MSDRGFCPPSTIGGSDFPNNFAQLEHQQHSSFNGYSPLESTQNGHYTQRSIPGPSANPYQETSPMKSMFQSGNANFTPNTQTSYAGGVKFDPFGYRNTRTSSYNIQQQQRTPPNFIPGSKHHPANTFVVEEQQHSRNSPNFGGYPSHHHPSQLNNGGGNNGAIFGGIRPSTHHHQQQPLPFLQGVVPPQQFHHPSGNQRSYTQQHFGSIGTTDQQPAIPLSPGRNNFDMMVYSEMNGAGNGHPAGMMNGTGNAGAAEFPEDFCAPGDIVGGMPAQYVLSNELLGRIDKSSKKQALLELQIGLEQVAFDTTTNFNTWAIVIKERMNGRESLPEPDMRIAAEMIVEMSVVLDDSQYNYSRLCQFLCANIDNFGQNLLLPQVSAFVTETNTFLSPQHLRNLVTFLAELYDKIEIKGVKSSHLAAHLFDQLHNLQKISNPLDDQSIGVIIKAMKLTGRFLENDRGPQAMDEFFSELEEHTQNASDNAKEKVQSLIALRSKRWGIVETNAGNGASSMNYPSVGILGPDGEQLTEEEYNFLDDTFDNFGNSPSGSLYNNPMEEDNVEDDYEQFLQATAIQAAEKALEKVSIDEDDESVVSSPKFPIAKH